MTANQVAAPYRVISLFSGIGGMDLGFGGGTVVVHRTALIRH